jgi:extradiol dioxygenase family protein
MPVLHLSIPVRDLDEARTFYESVLGCEIGRVREDWLDVWFFGMQLTLQLRPDEVAPADRQGVRHFGVALDDADAYVALIDQLRRHDVRWVAEPTVTTQAELSGKTGAKVADPSGNTIELKFYADPAALRTAT